MQIIISESTSIGNRRTETEVSIDDIDLGELMNVSVRQVLIDAILDAMVQAMKRTQEKNHNG